MPPGDRTRFFAEVGPAAAGALRRVDLWAAGRWLTCDDNMAFVPQLRHSIAHTASYLRAKVDLSPPRPDRSAADNLRLLVAEAGTAAERHAFLRWGPTTDNVDAYLFRIGDRVSIAFQFWRPEHPVLEERGQVFEVALDQEELLAVLDQLLSVLAEGGYPEGAED